MKFEAALIAFFSVATISICAYAQSDTSAFRQAIENVKQQPANIQLRKDVITLAQSLDPQPAVPEEAQRSFARGVAAIESSTSAANYKIALTEFTNATTAAPWWSSSYFNLGLVQEYLKDFDGAAASYRLYLLASPDASDADAVKQKLYKIEFMAEKKNRPKEILLHFSTDIAGLSDSISPKILAILQSRFQNAKISDSGIDDPTLVVDIKVSGTSWSHSCGLFSCDVSVSSQAHIYISAPSGIPEERSYNLASTHGVSKGNSGFTPDRHVTPNLPTWIGDDLASRLGDFLNENGVRTIETQEGL